MEQLAAEVKASRTVFRSGDLDIQPDYLKLHGGISTITDMKAPIKGIGPGYLVFKCYPTDDPIGKLAGVNTEYVLDIDLHMDKATEDQARQVWDKSHPDFILDFSLVKTVSMLWWQFILMK